MSKNILPIIAIFFCTAAAWVILGSSIVIRTDASDRLHLAHSAETGAR